MKKDETLEIDGDKYILRGMKTSTGARTLLQLGRMLLPSVKPIASIFEFKSQLFDFMEKPVEMDVLMKHIGEQLHEEEMMKIVETVLEPLSLVGKESISDLKPVYDMHFSGRYETLFKVFFAALKHNYASFFADLPGIAKAILPAKKS